MAQIDLKSIPNLPGYNFRKKKAAYHKPQTFGVVGGVRIEHEEGVTFDRPRLVKAARPLDQWQSGSLPDSTSREEFKVPEREHTELPAWDAFDRVVLRFYGYFKESVVETNLENHRVRNLVIYYYLEDDTMQIIEKKVDNSGLPQGQLIRRHRFPSPNGGYLTPADLQVGGFIPIYGKIIKLVECDPHTREYYRVQDMEQPPGESLEEDSFSRSTMATKSQSNAITRTFDKHYNEVMAGGGHVNADLQQFLEWDRKVCRFFAVQDDLKTPQFERRPFVLLYFLSDDTIEIREMYPLNCGRDNFAIFYRRNKMPRGNARLRGPLDDVPDKSEYISVEEFAVAEMINLMGNQYYIYDADQFTRDYFKSELGLDLAERQDVTLPERAAARPSTPPYTGYGSWDDSMGSVLQLVPKRPKKDFNKLFNNDGKILRFTARFANAKVEDADRVFVVCFHLFDDTMSIHEPPQRNLGIITGKFLEKAIHMNQRTGQLFKPEDLTPGSIISVTNRQFEIVDWDEYTRKYFENEESESRFDLSAVLEKLRESMRQQFPNVREIFRKFDEDKDGVITAGEFRKALQKFGFMLPEESVLILMKHFDTRKDGQISYNEFCDALLDEDYTTAMMQVKHTLNPKFDANYAEKARRKKEEREETEAVRKAVRTITDALYKYTQTSSRLSKEFAHMTHLRTVTDEMIHSALAQLGFLFELIDVQRTVLFVMGQDCDLSAIPYIDFLKSMVAVFHDMHKIR